MRTAFIRTIERLAADDPRVVLVTGDLGFGVVERFAERFPDRFVNAGVAEQGMTGIAAGMAQSGKVVFTYSIANFPTLRCLEQIRNDVCYHRADVKIVAVGGGLAYGALGYSHHGVEDLAVMRALPGMTVVAPGDPIEAELATWAVARHPGPCYLRLGKAGEQRCHSGYPAFTLGKALTLREGSDCTLISTGAMLPVVLDAAILLERAGIECRVLSMHTIKPLDTSAILRAAAETEAIVTVEEHSLIGGLGSAVAEVLAEHPDPRARLVRIGLPSECVEEVGSQEHLRAVYGLTPEAIATRARAALQRDPVTTAVPGR